MTQLDSVLVAVRWKTELTDRLARALAPAHVIVVSERDQDAISEHLSRVDAAILSAVPGPQVLAASGLTWLHVDHAGIDRIATPELLDGSMIVTTSAGRSGPAIGEQAIALLLAVTHDVRAHERMRRRRTWSGRHFGDRRALVGRRMVIIGCGHTGSEVGRRARAMGISVTGIRRSVARSADENGSFDRVFGGLDRVALRSVLGEADILVLAAPLNDGTHHLIGEAEFSVLPEAAVLINVARGNLVDERALVAAVRNGRLAGAGLDVVADEPLRPWSALWRTPGIVLSPHRSPRLPDRDERSLAIVERVVGDIRAGGAIAGALTADDAYTLGDRRPLWDRQLTRAWIAVERWRS